VWHNEFDGVFRLPELANDLNLHIVEVETCTPANVVLMASHIRQRPVLAWLTLWSEIHLTLFSCLQVVSIIPACQVSTRLNNVQIPEPALASLRIIVLPNVHIFLIGSTRWAEEHDSADGRLRRAN
jgi:hypothetical protein